jgi:hypothetical protein
MKYLIAIFAVAISHVGYANERATYPTFSFEVETGFYTTYKSEAVAFNDVGSTTAYGFATWAGKDRNLGFSLRNETATIAFEPASGTASSVAYTWQDVGVSYRFFEYFYMGAVFSNVDLKIDNQGTVTVDALGSGTGGRIGVMTPLGKGGAFQFEYLTVTTGSVKDVSDPNVAIGARADMNLKTSFKLLNWLQLTAGYRSRTYSVTATSEYAEAIQSTYLGFQLGYIF